MTVDSVISLALFLPFGVVVGIISVLFIKGIYWSEDFFESLPGNYYSRHSLGMLGQGLLLYILMVTTTTDDQPGHYYVQV